MANFLNKVAVSTASDKKHHFSLDCQTLCTQDFYKMSCSYFKELVPKSDLKIDMSVFSRTAPMPRPMLSSARIVSRCFFVPYRTVMRGFNEFITQTTYTASNGFSGIISAVPRIDNLDLCKIFVPSLYDSFASLSQDPDRADIRFSDPSDNYNVRNFVLTPLGRKALAILNSLGLKPIFPMDESGWREENENQLSFGVSALPLLSYAKVWLDWFSNPQYENRHAVELILNKEPLVANGRSRFISSSELVTLLQWLPDLTYNPDYFNSAWDSPVAPNHGCVPTVTLTDISQATIGTPQDIDSKVSNELTKTGNPYGTPQVVENGYLRKLTQYADDALHALTDYVTRFRLVGSRATDRYLAEHGVSLSAEKLNRSVYYGVCSVPLQISDVTQTAPSFDSNPDVDPLGTLAGKGVAASSGNHWDIHTDEYGIVLIMSFVDCKYFNPFGTNRMWQHINRFDFWTPDLDGLGTQAIRADELWSFQNNNLVLNSDDIEAVYGHSTQTRPDTVFGFTGRYNEYKLPFDNVHGDMLSLDGWNQYYDWFLYRDFASNFPNQFHLEHNYDFMLADGAQFNRIFAAYQADNPVDNFVTMFTFKVDGYFPMKPVWDTYDFEDEDKKAHRLMQLNGTNLQD